MRSLVTSELFEALPAHGLRVPAIQLPRRRRQRRRRTAAGDRARRRRRRARHPDGRASEQHAGRARRLVVRRRHGALGRDPRVAAWVAIAPPLRFRTVATTRSVETGGRSTSSSPSTTNSACPPEVQAEVAAWVNTTVEVVAGASHFFVGRTDRVVERDRSIPRCPGCVSERARRSASTPRPIEAVALEEEGLAVRAPGAMPPGRPRNGPGHRLRTRARARRTRHLRRREALGNGGRSGRRPHAVRRSSAFRA